MFDLKYIDSIKDDCKASARLLKRKQKHEENERLQSTGLPHLKHQRPKTILQILKKMTQNYPY